jgi:bacillaene synthase trans-acting acyltransferase
MSNRSVIFMFSGQGSQYYQMGRAFFDENVAFRSILLQLNEVATPLLGRSIVDVLYDDGRKKDELFDEIQFASAAIFIVEYALARVLIDDGIKPDYLLTSSMGIYAAAAIAAAVDPREALESVIKLATIYETQCQKGGMIAILGTPRLYRDLSVLRENSDLAAVNFASHFVISTADKHLNEIEAVLSHEKVAFQRVAVSRPFHSRWIDHTSEATLGVLGTLRYQQPMIPLICCARSAVLEAVTPESIWNSVRRPIEFERTIAELEKRGPHHYVDVGPAGTLVTFLKYALPSTSASQMHPILSPFGSELKNYERLTSERGFFRKPDSRYEAPELARMTNQASHVRKG